MTIGFLFWVLMIFWLVFGLYTTWPREPGSRAFGPVGGSVLLFILLFLVGWRVFGFPLHD